MFLINSFKVRPTQRGRAADIWDKRVPGQEFSSARSRPQRRPQIPPDRCPAAPAGPARPGPAGTHCLPSAAILPGRLPRAAAAVPRPQIPRGRVLPTHFPRPPRRPPRHRAAVPLREGSGERAERVEAAGDFFLTARCRGAKVLSGEGRWRALPEGSRGGAGGASGQWRERSLRRGKPLRGNSPRDAPRAGAEEPHCHPPTSHHRPVACFPLKTERRV